MIFAAEVGPFWLVVALRTCWAVLGAACLLRAITALRRKRAARRARDDEPGGDIVHIRTERSTEGR